MAVQFNDQLPRLWGRRGLWQIKLRWGVAPLMIAGLLTGRALGFEFKALPILAIAIASPLYNSVFAWVFSRYRNRLESDPGLDRLFTVLEILADYVAMFLLIYFTGGTSSPMIVFLLFHVIIAAIQFSPAAAYRLAGLAAAGLWLLLFGQVSGWLPGAGIVYRGEAVHFLDRPVYALVMLAFFTATLFLTAVIVTRIMGRLRMRVDELAQVSSELASANKELNSLYAMLCAIGAERHLEPVLAAVTAELAKVSGLPAVTVKLLSEDGKSLSYVASYGLPDDLIRDRVVVLEHSPLNRRIVEGETLVEANLTADSDLQLAGELRGLGIESVLLAPLRVRDRVIGSLSFYSRNPLRFQARDKPFLQLAAELVAIAIDDAQAYDAIEELMRDRAQFMLEVAHNLRAPLGAGLSILALFRDGYLGEMNERQSQHLHRLESRLVALDQTVGELLAIARTRDLSREIPDVIVDPRELAALTEKTFRAEAERKGLRFSVTAEEDLPPIDSGENMLEQLMQNLVSNAVKYTPEGGEVEVRIDRAAPQGIRISVRDSGIGIPAAEQGKLFKEFFRASNAKRMTTSGTGLGLALVQQTVERHQGRLELTSEEGEGTRVVIHLPAHREEITAPSAF